MAPSRRSQAPPAVRLSAGGTTAYLPDLPPISALFLIDFDVKAGYTIVWKQASSGIELEGLVEYKSLPSGLHTVKDDLIYFVHEGGHAGLSAFVNTPCDDEGARHARMIAVGVLVPLSYGRLGRAWRHAEGLKQMAARLAEDKKDVAVLEQYWEKNKGKEDPAQETRGSDTPLSSPSVSFQSLPRPQKGHTRNRSASDGTVLLPPGHRLSPYHPAWSLTNLLDTFGPLIFPIHRAALLRKRILISCSAPVHEVCNFVYDISVLSNIPLSVTELLSPPSPAQRLRPLFTIGVHDIPFLVDDYEASKRQNSTDEDAVEDESGTGWIACTTDSILAMKDTLWDMLITLPPSYSAGAKEKAWPTVEWPQKVPIKASQRDLRRFRTLRAGLARLTAMTPAVALAESPRSENSTTFRLSTSTSTTLVVRDESDDAMEKIVEPLSWAALAYSGFMWWASAGEQGRTDEADESARDAALLADLAPPNAPMMVPPAPISRTTALGMNTMVDSISSLTAPRAEADDEARPELAIIAYFHRLTAQMLALMADVVDSASDDGSDEEDESDAVEDVLIRPGESDGEDDERRAVRVTSRAMESMGLDVWNKNDADFVRELMSFYFSRRAYIEGKGVEVCGVRVC